MTASDTKFTGSIPALYDRYLGPLIFQPYRIDIAARIADLTPRKVLEPAAGTGIVTEELAQRLPSGASIVATDLNPAMLEIAGRKVIAQNVAWQPVDATAMPFEDGAFD